MAQIPKSLYKSEIFKSKGIQQLKALTPSKNTINEKQVPLIKKQLFAKNSTSIKSFKPHIPTPLNSKQIFPTLVKQGNNSPK